MNPRTKPAALGTTLVVGGCGFVGYHLVQQLLLDEECDDVYVLDRNVDRNLHDKALYVRGDVTDSETLRALVAKIQPRTVFHAASPIASLPARKYAEFVETNVEGTRALLAIATDSSAVKAFIYTSTIDVYANPPHTHVKESHPLWPHSNTSNEYNRTKSIADCLVRSANGPRLRTVSLRLGHAYGERQSQGLSEVLDMCSGNRMLIQIGRGDNLVEVVSAGNAATAHILAAKALLDPDRAVGDVDGEAFNISDGAAVPFWHHVRVIWTVARGEDAIRDVTVLPAWIMMAAVLVVEWLLWITTLDTVKPPTVLRRTSLEYCIYSHTYSIEKARERLRFRPFVDHDAVLAHATRWMLDYQKSEDQLKKE
ncbi:Uncharacterized protein TCAP_03764 [Tolypocladium capitatum]|uniref:3-beta hydroxysteroid dehydrogenase/isomerase domain-containing protein n=1 Tax=Tolypocladium capitatum TaxID=45235 RepID=A0A2K3QFH9_9HYPO|nr:Uncharacterized protein TCAP_03764 [Tolypocladium capitatum]